jgi:hypothetical protein
MSLTLMVREPFHMPVAGGEMMEKNTLLTDDEAAIVRERPHLLARCIQLSAAAAANIVALNGGRVNPPAVDAHVAAQAAAVAAVVPTAPTAPVVPPVTGISAPASPAVPAASLIASIASNSTTSSNPA